MDLVFEQLDERFEIQARKKVRNYPFLMGEGVWLDSEKLQALANLEHPVRLVIALGYAKERDSLREKKRKALKELVQYV